MKRKTPAQSRSVISDMMLPSQANPAGNVHGGEIMKIMDTCAGVAAMRHANCNVVTLRVDGMVFHSPVYVGQLVLCEAELTFVGRTSMEIRVTLKVEDLTMDEPARTALSAYFTFVALDHHGRPRPVPGLELETDQQRQAFEQGQQRYQTYKAMQRTDR
ncbi:MAG: acyl-CoA thioesterase [Ruminococcaceae bacterium]|nr:acyl-CoA thioesterase [Oscillospiraceae bacterium]